MQLENQVCSLEQAKRLKELEIDWDEKTLFIYKVSVKGEVTIEREGWFTFEEDECLYPAFTVAELLILYGRTVTIKYSQLENAAECLAATLIMGLERNHIAATDCNNRLNA